jgi:hypothetical protein
MAHAKTKSMKQNTLKIKYKKGHYFLKVIYFSIWQGKECSTSNNIEPYTHAYRELIFLVYDMFNTGICCVKYVRFTINS